MISLNHLKIYLQIIEYKLKRRSIQSGVREPDLATSVICLKFEFRAMSRPSLLSYIPRTKTKYVISCHKKKLYRQIECITKVYDSNIN